MNKMQQILFVINQSKRKNEYLKDLDSNSLFRNTNLSSTDKIILKKIIDFAQSIKENKYYLESLSNREIEIFGLVGIGLSSKEIAGVLTITESTVATHRKKIIKKLHLSGPGQLQKIAFQYVFLQLQR
jgi:DNA-binding CsgD family transcriptional regulator